mmetsp:Transcript_2765/g.8479  ORF Transcript_2765/g.8479 Transcript_2765/m.8479 type:complete len:81 (+) Transcript_2765:381-623(+)
MRGLVFKSNRLPSGDQRMLSTARLGSACERAEAYMGSTGQEVAAGSSKSTTASHCIAQVPVSAATSPADFPDGAGSGQWQ